MGRSNSKMNAKDNDESMEETLRGSTISTIPLRPSFTESYVHHLTRKRHTLEADAVTDPCYDEENKALVGPRGSTSNFTQSYIHHLSNNRDVFGYGSGRPSEDELAKECKSEILGDPKKPYLNKLMEVRGLVGVSRLNSLREQARRQRALSKAKQEARKRASVRPGDSDQDLKKDGTSRRAEVDKEESPGVSQAEVIPEHASPRGKSMNNTKKDGQSKSIEKQAKVYSKVIHAKSTRRDPRDNEARSDHPVDSKRVKYQKIRHKTPWDYQKPKIKLKDNKTKQMNKKLNAVTHSKDVIPVSNKNYSTSTEKDKNNLFISSSEPIASNKESTKQDFIAPLKTEYKSIFESKTMETGNKSLVTAEIKKSMPQSNTSLCSTGKNIPGVSSEITTIEKGEKCCRCVCKCRKSQINLENKKARGSSSVLVVEESSRIDEIKRKLLKKSSGRLQESLKEENTSTEKTLRREVSSKEGIRSGTRKLSLVEQTSYKAKSNVGNCSCSLGVQENGEAREKPPKLPPLTELITAIEESSKKNLPMVGCTEKKTLNSVKDIFFPNNDRAIEVASKTKEHLGKSKEDFNKGGQQTCNCLLKKTSKEWPFYRSLEAR